MSALPNVMDDPCFEIGRLKYLLGRAEADNQQLRARACEAEKLLEDVGAKFGVGLEGLAKVAGMDPEYFPEVRAKLIEAFESWDIDHTVPVCLACGSPRVNWVEGEFATGVPGERRLECGWLCHDCGAVEDEVDERRVA